MNTENIDIEEIVNLLQVVKGIREAGKAKRINNPIWNNKPGARKYLWEVQCRNCGHTTAKKSPDALYCSDNCKMDFFQKKKQAVAFTEQHSAEAILSFLQEYLADLPFSSE